MGRPQAVRTTFIHILLDEYETQVIEDKKIVQPSSPIWNTLFSLLDISYRPSNSKAIYTAALKWFEGKSKISESSVKNDAKFNISESSVVNLNVASVCETTIDSNDSNVTNNESLTDTAETDSVMKFKIELSYKVWETIIPVTKNYARGNNMRKYHVLKPGVWSNVILDAVTKKRRQVPCSWSFERNKCYLSGDDVYLIIRAHCNMCGAILCGALENEPLENEPVYIKFEIRSFDATRHENVDTQNVRVGGEYAKTLYRTNKPASAIRRDTLRKKASLFKKPYGRVPNANAIRCGKYRERQKEKISTCPFTAISYLKRSTKYMNTIHQIGYDPISIIYRSPAQVKLYKTYKKKNKFTEMTSDASAGVCHKLNRPGGEKSGQIFHYTMVISDGFQVPVQSMTSELNTANWLTFWMSEWVRETDEIPNQFTSDGSMAILNAAVRSFTTCSSVADYVDLMFTLLCKRSVSRPIPQCFVRTDIAHFMKKLTSCDALKNSPRKVRDFFIRCVAIMMQIDNIEESRSHIYSVLVVATSSTEGNSTMTNDPVPCEVHKRALIRKITGAANLDTAVELANTVNESVLKDTVEESVLTTEINESIEDSSIGLWLKSIVGEVNETKYFIDLCKLYPMWSAICCQFFTGSKPFGTSAPVESHIKVMKQSLEGIIPCSVDKFVQENMNLIEGMIIEASQDYIRFVSKPNEKSSDIIKIQETTGNATDLIDIYQDDVNVANPDVGSGEIDVTSYVVSGCPACKDGNLPSEAHQCILCSKNVHILPGCSLSIGDSEGYGEKRVCASCNSQQQIQQQNMVIEMGHTEEWSRKSKRDVKKSKYLGPVPHWNLNHHFNKNVKLGFLTNANMSSRVFSVNKEFVGLRNTDTFDSLAQMLAAIFAYIPTCRSIMQSTSDEIYKISIALAKNEHMKKVNTMRAQLLSTFIYEVEMSYMIRLVLENSPTCTSVWTCSGCENSTTQKYAFIQLKHMTSDLTEFNRDISTTIITMTNGQKSCIKCNENMTRPDLNCNKFLFLMFKEAKATKLSEIPDVIELLGDKILFGAILYIYPTLEGDSGHYISAIKINETWNIFDDMKTQPHFVSKNKIFVVNTLIYTEKEDITVPISKHVLREPVSVNTSPKTATDFLKKTTKHSLKRKQMQAGKENGVVKKNKNNASHTIPKSTQQTDRTESSSSISKFNQEIVNKIVILSNGGSGFGNTCAFESVVQILAGACAFDSVYKKSSLRSEDDIMRLAVLLAMSSSAFEIEKLRSKVLLCFGKSNLACVVPEILRTILQHSPSLTETYKCSSEACIGGDETTCLRPYLSMSFDVFDNNMQNIEKSVASNLNLILCCRVCENHTIYVSRAFGEHLFIEMPIQLVKTGNDYEKIITFKMDQLKLVISIDGNKYSLFGFIIFRRPLLQGGIGHYVSTIKVDDEFVIFDGLHKKSYILNQNDRFIIHCLFYKKTDEEVEDDSFNVNNFHSDDSLYRLYHKG